MKNIHYRTLAFFILCSVAPAVAVDAAQPHTGLVWEGTQTCIACHNGQARDLHSSSHYQWEAPALYTVNGPPIQGKLNTALNSYCLAILGNWGGCGSCHAGLGAKPEPVPTAAQLQNIDCLICHQKDYKRKKVNNIFVPDTLNMTITMNQAAQTVHSPERFNCLACHARSGGGDNNKRGDIAAAHAATTDRNFDVHMATTGANLNCQQCHTTQNHRMAGRGSDLRQTDLDLPMGCSTAACHTTKTTATGHDTAAVNRHIARVSCQSCHISAYARNAADTTADESTEIYRDYTLPEWNAALNRFEPKITRGGNLKPVYRFWNRYSWNYSVNDAAWLDPATGAYATSRPEGAIGDLVSKLYPFKYKKSRQPLAGNPAVLVALDTAVYFATGSYDNAVKAGLTNMGHASTTPYSNVESDTFQTINHEVMPRGSALTCTQCHTAGATQMSLTAMGYAMKGTVNTTCTQCHDPEDMPSYTSLHNKHVTDKKYDCSWCHTFSRPERGLTRPNNGLPDTISPFITTFGITASPGSLTVTINAFEALDDIAVTGYLVNENPVKPLATATGWTSTKPAAYTLASIGTKMFYAWAKDAAGNVSFGKRAIVNFRRIPEGDINGDGTVNLADALLALKVLCGVNPAGILPDYPSSGADVNGDGKIGFAEIIYIIQRLSGIR